MTKNTGGAAFPMTGYADPNGNITYPEFGMSLRDWFAGQALAALGALEVADRVRAKRAYEIADAMLAERAQ